MLVVVRLRGTRLKQIGMRRLLVNENNVLVAFEEVIRLLTTSRRYRTWLIRAIFLNVSSEKKIQFRLNEKQHQFQKRVEMERNTKFVQ